MSLLGVTDSCDKKSLNFTLTICAVRLPPSVGSVDTTVGASVFKAKAYASKGGTAPIP